MSQDISRSSRLSDSYNKNDISPCQAERFNSLASDSSPYVTSNKVKF